MLVLWPSKGVSAAPDLLFSRFSCDVNRHQPEEDGNDTHVSESFGFEQPRHALGARVIPDRFGNVAVRVGIADAAPVRAASRRS